jgi:hypothetical protein
VSNKQKNRIQTCIHPTPQDICESFVVVFVYEPAKRSPNVCQPANLKEVAESLELEAPKKYAFPCGSIYCHYLVMMREKPSTHAPHEPETPAML